METHVSNADEHSTNSDVKKKARHERAVQADVSKPHDELTEMGKGIAMTLPVWG